MPKFLAFPSHDPDALDSVEGQIFRNWNCIVINDTGQILNVPHPWVEMINTEGSLGPAKARNLGIAKSTTQAFVCLDADDILQPEALDEMYKVWKEERGVVYGQWWEDKGNGELKLWNPPEFKPELLVSQGSIHASCAMYSHQMWQEVGGFDPNIRHWEDWEFQIAYVMKGYCATKIEKPLFTYRHHTGPRS